MKKFFKSLKIFIELYRAGFFFSENRDVPFYRFNYEKDGVFKYAIFDIDWNENKKFHYHVHGGENNKTLFRVDGIK